MPGFASGRGQELCRESEDPVKGNVGPAGDLKSVTGSGLCRGSRDDAEDPAGPDLGLCPREGGVSAGDLGAGPAARSEGTLGPAVGAAGSGLCQKEPGVSTGGLGSCPGVWALPGLGGNHWNPRARGGLGRFEPECPG